MTDSSSASAHAVSRDPQARQLRAALGANALFSLTSAATFSLAPGPIAHAVGLPALVIQVLAGGLVAFAIAVAYDAYRARPAPRTVLAIVVGDLGWVLGSVAFVAMHHRAMTGPGVLGTVAIAALVGFFGVAQLRGLVRHFQTHPGAPRSTRHCVGIEVDTPPAVMWARIRDLGSIAEYHAGLEHSVFADGTRTCESTDGQRWSEELTRLNEPARTLQLRFISEAPDFPFPVDEMVGGWEVHARGTTSLVRVWWEMTPHGGWWGQLATAHATPTLDADMQQTVRRMGGDPSTPRRRTAAVVTC